MDEDALEADALDVDHLQAALRILSHSTPTTGEHDRFAVLQVDQHLLADVLLGEGVPGAVVEDVAVLEHLDEGRSLVIVRPLEHLHHVLAVHVVGAGDERRLGAQRQTQRVERLIHRSVGGRLGDLADLARRRVLTLGQAVDHVVEHQDREVDVATQRVQQVIAADRQHVAVAADHPHVEIGPSQGQPGGDGWRSAVDAVHAIGVHVVREPGGTPDAGHEHGVFTADAEFGHQELDGGEDRVVTASRTPPDLLVARPIGLGRERDSDGHVSHRELPGSHVGFRQP